MRLFIDQLSDHHRGVIAEMRQRIMSRGHYQSGSSEFPDVNGPACLVVNQPALSALSPHDHNIILGSIVEAAEVSDVASRTTAIHVNDLLDTEELIDILAGLEVG
jgi:hypothetical protein